MRGSIRSTYINSACQVAWRGTMIGRKSIRLIMPSMSSLIAPTVAKAPSSSPGARVATNCSMFSRVAKVSRTGCFSAQPWRAARTLTGSRSGAAHFTISWTRPSSSRVVARTSTTPGPKAAFPSADSRYPSACRRSAQVSMSATSGRWLKRLR